MKIVFQAFLASAAFHAVYFVMTFAVDYAKTVLYRPNMVRAWENTEMLQQEVAFGTADSPFVHFSTFLGLAVICGIFLFAYQKTTVKSNHQEIK
ncbi:hypothetical protein [Planococcus shenhongbingii]|uniref:Menaquinol-cytochrome c reductase cytochrome b subunit n=1 Tax=Planococcus shenhongbingii TaxID=3058398 RepID=A0ABT8NGA4_9BACL|nr:hypothetical protein [Planococcus sp. N017]MDN7246926.1 hypothetical protein [Planococcus sp. N017]